MANDKATLKTYNPRADRTGVCLSIENLYMNLY